MFPKGHKVLKNSPFINDDSFFSVKFVLDAFVVDAIFFNLGGKGVHYSLSSSVHGVTIGPNLAISKVPNGINKRIKMKGKAG